LLAHQDWSSYRASSLKWKQTSQQHNLSSKIFSMKESQDLKKIRNRKVKISWKRTDSSFNLRFTSQTLDSNHKYIQTTIISLEYLLWCIRKVQIYLWVIRLKLEKQKFIFTLVWPIWTYIYIYIYRERERERESILRSNWSLL